MHFIEHYIFILVPFTSWFLAQFCKPFAHYLASGVWQAKRWYTSSGMPSSHSSTMAGLTTIIGLKNGFSHPLFALALCVTLIVMYDAKGVRNASGKHAAYLNTIMEDINNFFRKGTPIQHFKTELGHNNLQVFAGMVLGLLVAFGFYYIPSFFVFKS